MSTITIIQDASGPKGPRAVDVTVTPNTVLGFGPQGDPVAVEVTPAGIGAEPAGAASAAVAGLDISRFDRRVVMLDEFRSDRVVIGGRFTKVADAGSIAIIDGGSLLLDGIGSSYADPGYIYDDGTTSFKMSPGVAVVYTVIVDQSLGYVDLYLTDSATLAARHRVGLSIGAQKFVSNNDDLTSGGSAVELGLARNQSAFRVAIARAKTRGLFYWVIGGQYKRWTLLGVSYGSAHKFTAAYPAIGLGGTAKIAIADVSLVRFGDLLPAPDAAAYVNTRIPTSGTIVPASADGVHLLSPWEPAGGISPQVGATYELRYRVKDASNYLFVRLTSNEISRQNISAGKCVAGVVTQYADHSALTMGTTSDFSGVQVQAIGSTIRISSLNLGAENLMPWGTITETQFLTEAGVAAVWSGPNTPMLQSFPAVSSKYDSGFGAPSVTALLAIGDSKTAATNIWQRIFLRDAWKNLGRLYTFTSTTCGVGGSSLDDHWYSIVGGEAHVGVPANELDSSLETPSTILFNLGVNDIASWAGGGYPAQWETRLGETLDAIHAKWSGAVIYVVTPASTADAATINYMAAAIARVVAARSFTRAGHDERTWLRGDDNYTTMTADGVHYSAAGAQECADQWLSILP